MKNVKSLSELQNQIFSSIVNQSMDEGLLEVVKEKPPISISARVSIYQDGYEARLLDSLVDDFSKTEEFLGEEKFNEIASEFIKKNPSTYFNLYDYSFNFKCYLQGVSDELNDLAEQDWLIVKSHLSVILEEDKKLSASQIEEGAEFVLKINPTTFYKQVRSKFYLSYLFLNEVDTLVIGESEYELLNFISEGGKSLDDLSLIVEQQKIKEEELSSVLQNFLKKEIIYCERK